MFSRRLNMLRLGLRLDLRDPILLKEGREFEDQVVRERVSMVRHRARITEPDEAREPILLVTTRTQAGNDLFYIPGSSLRGALRSAAEQRARTFSRGDLAACDPFLADTQQPDCSCGMLAIEEEQRRPAGAGPLSGPQVYRHSCAVCRCFGHHRLRGRWGFSDALPAPISTWSDPQESALMQHQSELWGKHEVLRASAVISRDTGSAQPRKLYHYEVLEEGSFFLRMELINFELWQLGLLAYLLHDLEKGTIKLGSSTRRGLGRVVPHIESVAWQFGAGTGVQADSAGELPLLPLHTLATRAGLPKVDEYGFADAMGGAVSAGKVAAQPDEAGLPLPTWSSQQGLDSLWGRVAPLWNSTVEGWSREVWPTPTRGRDGEINGNC